MKGTHRLMRERQVADVLSYLVFVILIIGGLTDHMWASIIVTAVAWISVQVWIMLIIRRVKRHPLYYLVAIKQEFGKQ